MDVFHSFHLAFHKYLKLILGSKIWTRNNQGNEQGAIFTFTLPINNHMVTLSQVNNMLRSYFILFPVISI